MIHVTATDTAGHTYDAMLENDVAGGLDTQFGATGTPPGSVAGDPGSYSGVAVQPDGSIVAVNPASATNPIVRYDDTGAPDGTTFDDISSAISSVTAVAIQPQAGSFDIVVGGSGPVASGSLYSVARYNSDGTLDTTFGTNGIASNSSLSGTPSCLLVEPDGEIVLAGIDNGDLVLAGFTAAGQIDPNFGGGIVDLGAVSGSCDAVMQPGNKILVAAGLDGGTVEMWRLTAAGAADNTFAGGGDFTPSVVACDPLLATETDGEIVLAGLDASNDFAIQTYDSGGSAIGSPTSLSGFAPRPWRFSPAARSWPRAWTRR